MGDARRAALTALERCRRGGAWSDAVLSSVLTYEGLDTRDRGLAAALCYGVMQNRTYLDWRIAAVSSLPLRKIEPKVLDVLRISAYQLIFMDRIPASAAVNEGVKLTRAVGFARAAGFVNAVLRRLASAQEPPFPADAAERLSIQYSHPRPLVDALLRRLGEAETEALLRCDNAPAPAALQVNTLRTDCRSLRARLAAEGLETEFHPFLPDCLRADTVGDLAALPAFREGLFYVQDAAARLAVIAAEPQRGQKILDACAAPGGKSFAAAVAAGEADITACDLHENKLKRIRESAARLGVDNMIQTLACDARENRPDWNGAFDLVIADVPCSGLGVIRKKPDIRWKDPADFAALPEIQAAILKNTARYVRVGGTLLYSTCTVRQEENEDTVRAFLAEMPDYTAEPFSLPGGLTAPEGLLQLWPQRHGTDGFFMAKLRRMA